MTEQATNPPTTWQDRAAIELHDLEKRHDALTAFLGSGPSLPPEDMHDLTEQAKAMAHYRGSLSRRLARHGLATEYGDHPTRGDGLPDDWDRVPEVALYGAHAALDAARAAVDAMYGTEHMTGTAHNLAEANRNLDLAQKSIDRATAALASGNYTDRRCVGPWLRHAVAYALTAHEHAIYPATELPHGIVPSYHRSR